MGLTMSMNAPAKAHTHKEIMVILGGLMTGLLLAALDQTIVSTALKSITEDFNGLNHYTWVVTAYLLTSTASTPLYGKISDIYGRRPVFQFAIVTFLLGSLLAGAAQDMNQLIATRALQGLGATDSLINTDMTEQITAYAHKTTPHSTVRKVNAIMKARTHLSHNAAPLLTCEALMCQIAN